MSKIFQKDWKDDDWDDDDWGVDTSPYAGGDFSTKVTAVEVIEDHELINRCYLELEAIIGQTIHFFDKEDVILSIRNSNYSPGAVLKDLQIGSATDYYPEMSFAEYKSDVESALTTNMGQISLLGENIKVNSLRNKKLIDLNINFDLFSVAHSDISPFDFSSPSPDDLVFAKQAQGFSKGKKVETTEGPIVVKQTRQKDIRRDSHQKKIDSGQPKTPHQCHPRKKTKLLWDIEQIKLNPSSRHDLNIVIIGNLDVGKSTLMGHLFFLTETINQQQMHRCEADSNRIGKGSFKFAWIFDETEEERHLCTTMTCKEKTLITEHKIITVFDTPGHGDFSDVIVTSAAQADLGVLVVSAAIGDFVGSEMVTKEYLSLAKSLGISYLIVVINKMDRVYWSEDRYIEIQKKMLKILKKSGFRESRVRWIPCSGYNGDNLISVDHNLAPWYNGKCFLDLLDESPNNDKNYNTPFRMIVNDVYKDHYSSMGTIVTGQIEAGLVSKDDRVLLLPQNEYIEVKGIRYQDDNPSCLYAGQYGEVGLVVDIENISIGNIICDPENPVPIGQTFEAQIIIFQEIPNVIIKGHSATLNMQHISEKITIRELIRTMDPKTGKTIEENPDVLIDEDIATVMISCDNPIFLTLYSSEKTFGRFTLIENTKIIAAGMVTNIFS